jgi:hypothetical protein
MIENERLDQISRAVAFGVPAEDVCRSDEEFDAYDKAVDARELNERYGLTPMLPREFPPA